jgi:hypothetical protein
LYGVYFLAKDFQKAGKMVGWLDFAKARKLKKQPAQKPVAYPP